MGWTRHDRAFEAVQLQHANKQGVRTAVGDGCIGDLWLLELQVCPTAPRLRFTSSLTALGVLPILKIWTCETRELPVRDGSGSCCQRSLWNKRVFDLVKKDGRSPRVAYHHFSKEPDVDELSYYLSLGRLGVQYGC